MKKRLALTLLSALALSGFTGCGDFDPWNNPEPEDRRVAPEPWEPAPPAPSVAPGTNALEASSPSSTGEIGGVQALGEHVVWEASSFTDSYYGSQTYIELRTESDEGVTMQGLTLHVGVADLEPGDEFESSSSYDPDAEVDLLGCSGDDHGFLPYDVRPDELHVQVEEGPTEDTLLIQWQATLPTDDFVSIGSEECTGSVVIARQ